MEIEKIAKQIIVYSKLYYQKYSEKYNKKNLVKDSLEALNFFFGRVFYGGIWDSVCTKERDVTFTFIKSDGLLNILNQIKNKQYSAKKFVNKLKKIGVSNPRRGKMAYEILEWLLNIPDFNCITYSINKIQSREISSLFYQLDKIFFIGPKKASFFLRDLVDYFNLHDFLKTDEFIYVLPIDTYINKFLIALKLKNSEEKIRWENDAKKILCFCEKADISPIVFDQGVWYAYANNKEITL